MHSKPMKKRMQHMSTLHCIAVSVLRAHIGNNQVKAAINTIYCIPRRHVLLVSSEDTSMARLQLLKFDAVERALTPVKAS